MKLSKKQIKYYIENYGNDDIFVNYSVLSNGDYAVNYLPYLGKLASERAIVELVHEVQQPDSLHKDWMETIILSSKGARIVGNTGIKDKTLPNNFSQFLCDLDNEQSLEQ